MKFFLQFQTQRKKTGKEIQPRENNRENNKDSKTGKEKDKDKDKEKDKTSIASDIQFFGSLSMLDPKKGKTVKGTIRDTKKEVKKTINKNNKRSLVAKSEPIIKITWVTGLGRNYTYKSSKIISNIVHLTSDDPYFKSYAKNIYVHFDERAIWKAIGDAVTFQAYRMAFNAHRLELAQNDTCFTFREHNKKWELSLKVAHKKGIKDIRLFFDKTASTMHKDVEANLFTFSHIKLGHSGR